MVGPDQPCDVDMCEPGLVCDEDPTNRVCVPGTYLPKGSVCPAAGTNGCAPGLICDTGCPFGNCPIPTGRMQRLFLRRPEPLPADIRRRLLEEFREDIGKTAALIERSLSHWLD